MRCLKNKLTSKKKMWQFVKSFFFSIYDLIIVDPLRQLYYFGPGVAQFGFWGGMGATEMCQSLSPLSTSFWQQHPDECAILLETKFHSFRVTMELFIYFILLYKVWCFLNLMCWFAICRRRVLDSPKQITLFDFQSLKKIY
jgi:hypothetical protein